MKPICAFTFSLVYLHWKCNFLPICSCHNNFQWFHADTLKVRRFAVGHSALDSWRVETISKQTFQLLLVLIVKGYVLRVNLQKSAFCCFLPHWKSHIRHLSHKHTSACACMYLYELTVFVPTNMADHPCPCLLDSCPQIRFVDHGSEENHDLAN